MSEISNYVIPLFRRPGDARSFAGTAFCTPEYLVTAGHVLTAGEACYALDGGRWLPLRPGEWIPQLLPIDDKHGIDVAFYPVPGQQSPLSLASADARPNDELELLCWQWKSGELVQVDTRCLVLKEPDEDGYMRFSTVDRITHGASGCPVMRRGTVYGILAMGREQIDPAGMGHLKRRIEENTCWAYKSTHALRFLR